MKSKFYVSAIYTSPPNSMGGNTKILIEIIKNLSDKFDFIIFTSEPETFRVNLKSKSKAKIITIDYPFKKFNYLSHYSEIKHIKKIYEEYFSKNKIDKNDYIFTPSDFAPDVMPIYYLKKKYNFKWIASLFLFIPSPLENLLKNYKFPFIKYIIYYLYQKVIFRKMLSSADLFLITNDYDRKYFPKKFENKILAMYGGVNPEEIKMAKNKFNGKKIYDAVFCSRIHPQKGISQLLDVWALVVKSIPKARFAIIGNGEKSYEKLLKNKAKRLGIDKNVKWLGYINGVDKYTIYLQSKIFLHGSIYDNNGMVAAEALCSGLTVVMYDLPQFKKIYNEGCIKVGNGDKLKFAIIVINLIKNNKINPSLKIQHKLIEYWNWKSRIQDFYNFLK